MEPDAGRRAVPELGIGTLYANRYRILSPIGRGGMGRVYLAEDVRLGGRLRALKATAAAHSGQGEDGFIREARLLAELHHPQLPDIVDYVPPDAEGWAVIVMEYIAGESLGERFARNGNRMPFSPVARYFAQLCELLCYLHARRPPVVFRDLKPSNVLIDRHDRAVLVDFGIARAYRPDAASDTERLGTPAFAAPEQLRGEQTDGRTDLYGLGALAYFLLSGGQSAGGRSSGRRERLQEDVPPDFRELLEWTLAEEPSERPQSAFELLARLRGTAWFPGDVSEHTPRPPRAAIPSDGVTVAAVLSAYPGAGATHAALGLSRYLNGKGVSHALVELPGGDPELFGLLDGARNMPGTAVFADPTGQSDAVPAWQDRHARYYPASPEAGSSPPETAFGTWLRRLGVPLVLLDVSSKWELPGMADRLAELGADALWWVADSLPAKWSARRQRAAADIRGVASRAGVPSAWIANRDHSFPGRRQWLACFPDPPAARLPLLSAELTVRAAWSGEGFPAGKMREAAAQRAYGEWAEALTTRPIAK